MADQQERDLYCPVQPTQNSPSQVLHDKPVQYYFINDYEVAITIVVLPIFVLPTAVICVQNKVGFPEAVVLEVMVQEGNNTIGTLPYVHPLVYEVIDLFNESECHPPGQKVSIMT